jgi:predicted dehydrogenase
MSGGALTGAIIGCGRIVRDHHIPAWQALGRDPVANWTLADTSYESRLRAQAAMGVPNERAYKDYRALLIRERPDFAVISTPHVSHETIALDCLRAGVPVLVEKPMATSLAAARRMVETAERENVPLAVIHNYGARPQAISARQMLLDGAVGRPFLLRSETLGMGWSPGIEDFDADWRTKMALSGGGCLLDNGYHAIYMAESFLGEIETVSARVATYNHPIDVDDTAILLLGHAGGGTSSIQAAWSMAGESRAVNEVYGPTGTMRLEPDGAVAINRLDAEWERHASTAGAGFRNVFKNFLDVLVNGASPLASGADGLRTLRVVRAGYASSERGEVVHLADFDE